MPGLIIDLKRELPKISPPFLLDYSLSILLERDIDGLGRLLFLFLSFTPNFKAVLCFRSDSWDPIPLKYPVVPTFQHMRLSWKKFIKISLKKLHQDWRKRFTLHLGINRKKTVKKPAKNRSHADTRFNKWCPRYVIYFSRIALLLAHISVLQCKELPCAM